MFKLLINLFKKEEVASCPHGWKISNSNLLPHKLIGGHMSVCHDCAVQSSLTQMGSGTILSQEIADKLRERLAKIN